MRRFSEEKVKKLGLTALVYQGKVFLVFLSSSKNERKKYLQFESSDNGINFFRKEVIKGELITGEKKDGFKDSGEFRISRWADLWFLFYKLKGRKILRGAVADNFWHWKDKGRIDNFRDVGMTVPDYKNEGRLVFYGGGKEIRIGYSRNFRQWRMVEAPVFSLPGNLKDEGCFKIANIFLTEEGILLLYYWQKGEGIQAIKALLFSKENPEKFLWLEEKTIWEIKETPFLKNCQPLGVVNFKGRLISYWQDKEGKILNVVHCWLSLLLKPKRFFVFPKLEKIPQNPILCPQPENLWESKAVFNPAAFLEKGKVHLIYRAIGEDGVSVLGYANSIDGVNIDERLSSPIYVPRYSFEGKKNFLAGSCSLNYFSGGSDSGGCEDPRITKIGNRLYMTYVAYDGCNPPRIALTSIKKEDFLDYRWQWEEPVLISPPGIVDKNGCILPEKIKGKYVIFHRIFPNILIDFVDSLDFDGYHWLKGEYAIKPRKHYWDSRKIGVGPPPLKTKDGWLLIYHGVDDKEDRFYKIGAMLLDLEDPTKVIARCEKPILEPQEIYENEGWKGGVAYPCGAVIMKKRLLVYYGGADTVVCVAQADLEKFLQDLKTLRVSKLNFSTRKKIFVNN